MLQRRLVDQCFIAWKAKERNASNKQSVFINFHTHFYPRVGRGGSRLRRTHNSSRFSATSDILLAPHQDGQSQVGDVFTLPCPWSTSGPLM